MGSLGIYKSSMFQFKDPPFDGLGFMGFEFSLEFTVFGQWVQLSFESVKCRAYSFR